MSYWITPLQNLGIIKAGKPKKIVFKALETIPQIKQILPSCGCTAARYDEKSRELHVVYNNGAIPSQVTGPQTINNRIDIVYQDDTTEVLIIKVTKIR